MEASNGYFTSFKATEHENLLQKLHRLMKTAGFETIDFTDKYAAIKIHFEWKSCIAHAVKIGLGSDQYKLITIQLGIFVDSWTKGGQPLGCDHLFLFTADAYASASFALSNAISLEMISSQIWVTFFPSVATVMSATAS